MSTPIKKKKLPPIKKTPAKVKLPEQEFVTYASTANSPHDFFQVMGDDVDFSDSLEEDRQRRAEGMWFVKHFVSQKRLIVVLYEKFNP